MDIDDAVCLWGDCLERMAELPDGSVDLVLADLPYGSTKCEWDQIIPLAPMWAQFRRLLAPSGAVVLTACQPFTSELVTSNRKWFRYELVWDKVGSTGFLDANRRPLRRHESILVFGPRMPSYRPQMGTGKPYGVKSRSGVSTIYGKHCRGDAVNDGARFPTSIVTISNANAAQRGKVHPTQKPVELGAYLVRTFTDPGAVVLDPAMGSGSFGVAALETGRRFIGIERDKDYHRIASERIHAAQVFVA